jgi:hypothetical protein
MGWPAGPRGSGSRNLGSTRRSHARPGRPGELATGGSQVGAWRSHPGRCARCAWPQLEDFSPATAASTGERRARKLACGVRRRAGGEGLQLQYLACGLSYWLIGFSGPREEAEEIKQQVGAFLKERLHLTLSEEKTLITHARSDPAKFLGYHIVVLNNNHKHDWRGHRSINGQIGLQVPPQVIQAKSQQFRRHGKPVARKERTEDTPDSIITQYQQEYRGLAEYYQLAVNRYQLNRLKWVMERSLVATLAEKLRITVSQVYDRYETTMETPGGPRKVLQATVEREGKRPLIARWGGVSLARNTKAILTDTIAQRWGERSELEKRLLADTCELCGSHQQVEVHHVRALKDLQQKGQGERPRWMYIMAARRRKTLLVCRPCHDAVHAGRVSGKQTWT